MSDATTLNRVDMSSLFDDGPKRPTEPWTDGAPRIAEDHEPDGLDVSDRVGLAAGTVTLATHPHNHFACFAIKQADGEIRYPGRTVSAEVIRKLSGTRYAAQTHAPAATNRLHPGGYDPIQVELEAQRIRTREAAKKLVADEKAATDIGESFDAGLLVEILLRPAGPADRIAGLMPADGSTIVSAQRKTGKTTFLGNLTRSLITGEPFLDRFEVQPLTGRVGFLNYEVSAHQIARWLDEMGVPADRIYLANLRGRRNPLTHPGDRARLAAEMRAHEVEAAIFDPFSNMFPGENQNDNGEVAAFLRDLAVFTREEVGASDLVLAVHAGWDATRSRGASALEDWPDSIISLTKDELDTRYLRATGRDVDVPEAMLTFNHETRQLSMASDAGSRRDVGMARGAVQVTPAVVQYVLANPGCSQMAVEDHVEGNSGQIRAAIRTAADTGQITRKKDGRKWVLGPPQTDPSDLVPIRPAE
jgi:hypothetical protein